MNPEILRYIRQHRGVYTRDAIDRHLIEAGYPPEEIEASWRAVEVEDESQAPGAEGPIAWERPRSRNVLTSPRFWLAFVGYVVAVYGASILLSVIGSNLAILGLVFFLLALLGGIVAATLLLNKDRPVSFGLFSGIVTVILIPFVLFVILAGLCLVQLSSYR